MSQAVEVMRCVDVLMALPAPKPELVSSALGVALSFREHRSRYDCHSGAFARGPFATVDCDWVVGTDFGMVRLKTRDKAIDSGALDLNRFGQLPRLDMQSPSAPDPSASYRFTLRGGTLDVIFEFDHRIAALRAVIVRWGQPTYLPGEEPVFATAPPLLYIQGYDAVHEVLEYATKTRAFRVCAKEDESVQGAPLVDGYFAREGAQVAGYFATPEGPAFFQDKKRFLGAFGAVQGRIERIGNTTRHRFTLTHRSASFDLVYEERHGVGTNPYDTEREDVDLFAFIVGKLGDEAFFRRLAKPWPR